LTDYAASVAQALLDIGAVGFSPQKPLTFKSGLISPVYVDNRRLIYWPEQWHTVIQGFQSLLITAKLDSDVIAGVETAGIPHASALAFAARLPSVFVRKQAKEHGTRSRIEGGSVAAKRVVLIEDLVTTGGSSLSGVDALRAEGASVEHCLAIVSYGFHQSVKAFDEAGVHLHVLTTFPIILDVAVGQGKFAKEQQAVILDWLADPEGWAGRHGFV